MSLYFFPFLFSFLVSLALLGIFLYGIGNFSFLKEKFLKKNFRKEVCRKNIKNISRLGGVIAGGVFLWTLFLSPELVITRDIWGLIAGCLGMLLMGVWDDIRPMHWKWQLFFQASIVLAVVGFFGVYIMDIPNPLGGRIFFDGMWGMFFGGVITVGWFLLLMNALNWIDGVDGVAPGTIVIAGVAFFALSLRPEVLQPPVAIIALALLGSYLGLFLLNVHPAKIFSGTAGVFVAGFAIAYLSLFAGAKMATAFLVFGIPILDAFWVVFQRYLSGVSWAHPDKRHIHYVLLSHGWSERRVAFWLLGIIALSASVTLLFETRGKLFSVAILSLFFVFFALYKRKNNT